LKTYQRPYPEPDSRTFNQWCNDLGLECETPPNNNKVLTYDEFCFFQNIVLRKNKETKLYNWWRKYGDKWGECRTVKEWIKDFNWDEGELEAEDKRDLNIFIGYDEFRDWSSGKLSISPKKHPGILTRIIGLLK
jgi:hypothetical protein